MRPTSAVNRHNLRHEVCDPAGPPDAGWFLKGRKSSYLEIMNHLWDVGWGNILTTLKFINSLITDEGYGFIINQPCHAKTGIKIFVLHQAFFYYDIDYNIDSLETIKYYPIAGVIPKEGLAGLVSAKPSFGVTTTKILRPVLAWCSLVLCVPSLCCLRACSWVLRSDILLP